MDTMNFGFLLNDVSRLMRYKFDGKARVLGVTRPQWRLLLTLSRFPGESQAALADLLEVERITLCRMIDRLQEAQFLERRPDPNDRRVWRIFLTPKGEDIIGKLQTIAVAMQRELLTVLEPGEEEQLQSILSRLRDALKRSDGLSATA